MANQSLANQSSDDGTLGLDSFNGIGLVIILWIVTLLITDFPWINYISWINYILLIGITILVLAIKVVEWENEELADEGAKKWERKSAS